jgi:hypothetical protein
MNRISMLLALMARDHGLLRIFEQRQDGTVTSPNWSGYAVTSLPGAVTGVTGSWVVPAATCTGTLEKNTGASFWVGIDGYTSATVEQTGTDADCSSGNPVYYAWYEFFPAPGITISAITVQPGDVMNASVTYDGTEFTASITDETTNESFTISKAVPGAKRDSAEWIGEDNAYVFTDFQPVLFASNTATVDSFTKTIGGYPTNHAIVMTTSNNTGLLAVPSALSPDGASFVLVRK